MIVFLLFVVENKERKGRKGKVYTVSEEVNHLANGYTGHSGAKQGQSDDETLSPMSQTFFYPPPASKAPSPPRDISPSSGDKRENKIIYTKDADEVMGSNVLDSPLGATQPCLPIANNLHSVEIGISSCHINGDLSSGNDTMEDTDNDILPVAVPQKFQSCQITSGEGDPVNPSRNTLPPSQVCGGVVDHGGPMHQYDNVRKLGRMNSAPALPYSGPVYAELTPVNKNTRLLSRSVRACSSSNKREKNRQNNNPFGIQQHRLLYPESKLPCNMVLVSPDTDLVHIVEAEELIEDSMSPTFHKDFPVSILQPEDYIEPVQKNV